MISHDTSYDNMCLKSVLVSMNAFFCPFLAPDRSSPFVSCFPGASAVCRSAVARCSACPWSLCRRSTSWSIGTSVIQEDGSFTVIDGDSDVAYRKQIDIFFYQTRSARRRHGSVVFVTSLFTKASVSVSWSYSCFVRKFSCCEMEGPNTDGHNSVLRHHALGSTLGMTLGRVNFPDTHTSDSIHFGTIMLRINSAHTHLHSISFETIMLHFILIRYTPS